MDIIESEHRRGLCDITAVRRRRRGPRLRRRDGGLRTWRWSTPSERQHALLKFADHIEANADELVAIEVQDTGKPTALTKSEEIGPMVDQIRFFAGAARVLEGRSQGSTCAGIRRRFAGNRSGSSARWRRGTTR